MDYLVLEGVILSDCLKRRYSQFHSKTQTGEITDIAEAFRIKTQTEEMTKFVGRISQKRKKAVERKQWSDMQAKFGHKDDISTIIFTNRFNGFE